MKKIFVRLLSMVLSFAIMMSSGIVGFAEGVQSLVEDEYDYYADFPIRIETETDMTSEDILNVKDTQDITFSTLFSLKDNYSQYDGCNLTVSQEDEQIYTEDLNSDDITSLDLKAVTTYSINLILTGDDISDEYVGKFSIMPSINGTLDVDIVFTKVSSSSTISIMSAPTSEVEPNNDWVGSQAIGRFTTANGKFSSSTDTDWYKISSSTAGYLDIYLKSSGVDADLNLYQIVSGGLPVKVVSSTGTNVTEYIRYYINSSTYYYIEVIRKSSSQFKSTNSYTLNTNVVGSKAFFSQYYGTISGVTYWDTYLCDKLYVDGGKYLQEGYNGIGTDVMEVGCGVSAFAMMLRNKNLRRNAYDFRAGNIYGALPADPYMVMLANNSKNGSEITISGSNYYLSTNYDVSCQYTTIASNYNTAFTIIGSPITPDTPPTISQIASALASRSEGVVVQLKNTRYGSHFVLFMSDLGSSLSFGQRFKVCDPGASTLSTGYNVLFANSTSAKRYSQSDIVGLYYIS